MKNMNRFNFADYTNDELEYVKDTLIKALDMFADAEIALCDAHVRHNEEPTLTNWNDLYNALREVESALDKR